MEVRLYEENEIHRCTKCSLMFRVTFAAVPIEPVRCCGELTDLLGVFATDEELDVSETPIDASAPYQPGQVYTCGICGLDVSIIQGAAPAEPLDCCGEGMELRS